MTLTTARIQQALNNSDFWMFQDSEDAAIIREATKRQYVVRLSHTQCQWTEEGLERAKIELSGEVEEAAALIRQYLGNPRGSVHYKVLETAIRMVKEDDRFTQESVRRAGRQIEAEIIQFVPSSHMVKVFSL